MNYLITKSKNDGRITICGLVIPDGFFVVMGLTFKNQRQIKLIQAKDGYDVTETDLPEGCYTPEAYRVDKYSIRDWALKTGPMIYLDGEPIDSKLTPADRDHIRPPDISHRPAHLGLDDVASEENVVLPPAVALARKRMKEQEAAGITPPEAPTRADSGQTEDANIPAEDDMTTLKNAGAVDEVAMLRAALDSRGITYSPLAHAASLRKKLEQANAA